MFEGHRQLPAIVEAVVEGRLGSIVQDDGAARLSLGCYHLFAGAPGSAGARRLVAGVSGPCELVYGNDPAWRRLIQDVHGSRVSDRPMREFDGRGLDATALRTMVSSAAVDVVRLDEALAGQLDDELEPHALQVYGDAGHFAADGVGFGTVVGGRLVCAATSYTRSSGHLEVAVSTRSLFRGQGLAASVSAALLLHCLETGLVPCWSASNPVSQRLAVRLGFAPAGICEVLLLA